MSDPNVDRRAFLSTAAGGAALASVSSTAMAQGVPAGSDKPYNVIVIGGGNAGMPTAIFAAKRGGRVLVIEAAGQLGGTLHMSSGQMSAGGTKLQKSKGIQDSGQLHYDDVMRISKNTADADVVRLAVMNAADTFDWLMDNGLDVYPEHPILGNTHEPYSQPRYAWGQNGGRSILRILDKHLQPEIDAGRVTVLLNTKAKELITSRGAVTGVVVEDMDGKRTRYMGDNIVLTAGGCASNKEMFEVIDAPVKNYNNSSYPFSQGEGITLGRSVGGFVRYGDHQLPMLGGILEDDQFPSPMIQTFRPFPPTRPPYEIYVNEKGERFVQEDIPSHDALEEGLKKQKDIVYWMVFDEQIFWAAPQIMNPRRWTRAQYTEMFNNRPFFHKADTLEELGKIAGIDGAGLMKTVEAYNEATQTGVDKAFNRKVMPLPLLRSPYYAIKCHGWKFMSFGGLAVNKDLQIIKRDGTPVKNLYAAGEVIGAGATMGRSHVGGMCVTPALTLGRLLGQRMLTFRS